jgi:hypothetical protein
MSFPLIWRQDDELTEQKEVNQVNDSPSFELTSTSSEFSPGSNKSYREMSIQQNGMWGYLVRSFDVAFRTYVTPRKIK